VNVYKKPIKKQGGDLPKLVPHKAPPPIFGTWEDMRGNGLSVPKQKK